MVTGSNGFVGRALCAALNQDYQVMSIVRQATSSQDIAVGDLSTTTDWSQSLGQNTEVVVHLAGHVPLSGKDTPEHIKQHFQVNALATAHLARQSAQQGVKRFIFISTVKVLGEGKDLPYRDTDSAIPVNAYASSKWEAEQMLWQIAAQTGMEVVVLRPPVVYGPGVKGNFLRLLQVLDKSLPLPLGAIKNQRSFIYVDNLVDAIRHCLTHPKAAGKSFLVSDGEDVSTPELMRRLAHALNRRAYLIPIPSAWIQGLGQLLGKQAAIDRLLGSLYVDITPIGQELAWQPPYTLQAGLQTTAQWYRQSKGLT